MAMKSCIEMAKQKDASMVSLIHLLVTYSCVFEIIFLGDLWTL